jgi:RNA polymerase sigma-70 factor, ECF subfamily
MGDDRDSTRLEELFAQHERGLGRFIAQLVHNRQLADDLLQETFLSAWRSRADLDHIENQRAWLYAVARHRVLMYLRGWRRAIAAYERFLDRQTAPPADEAEAYAVRDLMARTLSAEEQSVIVLFHLHGFSTHEIGEIVGRSDSAVRKQLERSRRKLAVAHQAAEATGPTRRRP